MIVRLESDYIDPLQNERKQAEGIYVRWVKFAFKRNVIACLERQ